MDVASTISSLQTLSPFIAACATLLIALKVYLDHKRQMAKTAIQEKALGLQEKSITGLKNSLTRYEERAAAVSKQLEEVRDMLTAHDREAQSRGQAVNRLYTSNVEQLGVLRKIAQELVQMNANQPGQVVSIENSKIIVTQQWNYLRHEVGRLLLNSIKNNHFLGNENVVARKVISAWRRAARTAREEVDKIRGIRYPYKELFESHTVVIWERSWNWALPLYHHDVQDPELGAEDLRTRIDYLFDDILREFFRAVEDIDSGSLYREVDQSMDTPLAKRSDAVAINDAELAFAATMGDSLRNYVPGSSSGGYSAPPASKGPAVAPYILDAL